MGYETGVIYGFGFTGRGTMEDIAEVLGIEDREDMEDYSLTKEFEKMGFELLKVDDLTYYDKDEWLISVSEGSGQVSGNEVEGLEEIFDPERVANEAIAQLRKMQDLLQDEFYLGNRVLAWRLFGRAY